MREIVPVHKIKRRVPEQGRIRMGRKVLTGELDKNNKPKSRPSKLTRLRFTSGDKQALDVIADKYGGDVTPWTEGPHDAQFEVTVTQEKVPIVLPPDPLSGTPIYEHWSGGGCQRRCDGIDCTLPLADNAAPDAEQLVVACPCRAENRMQCKPRTRLNVALREVPFGGTWRIESTGWNAAEELPGQVDMVLTVQETGMVMAELSIAQRTRLVRGQTKKFVVPCLTLPESIEALAAGSMRLKALGQVREIAGNLAALPAAKEVEDEREDWIDGTDEVVDAELVEEPDDDRDRAPGAPGRSGASSSAGGGEDGDGPAGRSPAGVQTSAGPAAPAPPKRRVQSPRVKALHAGIRQLLDVPDVTALLESPKISDQADQMRHGLVLLVTEGRSSSTTDTNDDEQARMLTLVGELLGGERRLIGFADDGRIRLSARKES